MEATITLDKDMIFLGAADSGHTVRMGNGAAESEAEDGVRPMELVLIGLGGCTAMDIISILRKKRQEVTGLQLQLSGRRAEEHPKVFTHITVKYIVRGRNVEPAAVERAIELSRTKYCPVQAMLSRTIPIDLVYEIIEEPV